jgi:GNAT superfamily N-acetyltransferase
VPLEIRILGPGDEDVLRRAAPGVFDDPVLAGPTHDFLSDPRHRLAVALDDGMVVGFVSAVELWINEVGVAETHRACGIGKALLAAILARAGENGSSEAWVLTERANAAAMRLYASAGGVEAPRDQVMFTFAVRREPRP